MRATNLQTEMVSLLRDFPLEAHHSSNVYGPFSVSFRINHEQLYGRNHRVLAIWDVYVHPPERGKGIATLILRDVESVARQLKLEAIVAYGVDEPARAALLRRGFRVIERAVWADLLKYVV